MGAASGLGGRAGAPQQGGAAGAVTGGAGADGSPSVAWRPLWLPTGAFGDAAQHVVNATTEYVFWLCANSGLPIAPCIRTELHNFAPSLEWLACASRAPGADPLLEELAAAFYACAAEARECRCVALCEAMIPDLPDCPSFESNACPNGGVFVQRCDESNSNNCADGYDQRNCDPLAPEYDCGDGGLIAWTAVCDGSADCDNGVDEFRCGPPEQNDL